jgi:signal transduction histidine kinase
VTPGSPIELALPEIPLSVIGDRDELYEVFENLIDNAIKYGADGGKVDIALSAVTTRRASARWSRSPTMESASRPSTCRA